MVIKYKALKDIVSIRKGKKAENIYPERIPESIPYILIESFKNNIAFADAKDMVICRPEDILIVWDGARAGLSTFGHNGAIGSTIAKLEIRNKNEVYHKYLYYFINSKYVQLNQNTHGAAIPHLNKYYLEGLDIPILPMDTQHTIATILETCESAIRKRKETNRLTDEFLKSVFLEMFGDPHKNPKDYKKQTIGKLITEIKNEDPAKYPDRIYNYIDISSIDNISKTITAIKRISGAEAPSRARQLVESNDILVSTVRPNLNAVALVPRNIENPIASTGFCVLRVDKSKISEQYLFEICKKPFFIETLTKIARGASYPAVTDNDIKRLHIPMPSIPDQQKFADLVQRVENLKQKQRESEKELNNLFNSLMQRAFRGWLCCS